MLRLFLCLFDIKTNRLSIATEEGGNIEVNNPGCYPTVCVELSIDCFAVNTVLQVLLKHLVVNQFFTFLKDFKMTQTYIDQLSNINCIASSCWKFTICMASKNKKLLRAQR